MTHLFERKQLEDFSDKVRSVFNLMTISRKYKVIGSGGLKDIKYSADYDLNELFRDATDSDDILNRIYLMFKSKFAEAEKNPDVFITDFKCGMDDDGEPLRWNKHDIKKGYKIMSSGRKIRFQDCILIKTTMKIDMIVLINGRFVEFSDNYFIKLGDEANFFPHDADKDHILNSIKHSYDEYMYVKSNYFKALKRSFAWMLMDGEEKHQIELRVLLKWFNSVFGLLYKLKSELETIELVIENKSGFREPKISDIKTNLKLVAENLETIPAVDDVVKLVKHAMTSNSKKAILDYLDKAINRIFDLLNSASLDFILKNKNVVLY